MCSRVFGLLIYCNPKGVHATDGSYAQLFHWYAGSKWDGAVNVSVAWGTVAPSGSTPGPLHDLRPVKVLTGLPDYLDACVRENMLVPGTL